ncbi:hypothetical protein HT136_19915 [Novosphingobium profundi]|uniref:hypothetical protein n=1 Tax=Novosphingobium profundi TaxID=1774954 RepID=UPI001BDB3BEF|nr:hypothetical protein [Novosphingobium profundi]MBT0670638.1 hypothetical protein [Novosphingobium profundi]
MLDFTPAVSKNADAWETLVRGLEAEFGHGAGLGLAQRFLDAEECDFLWEARRDERWLGGWEGEEEGRDLDRIAIMGKLGRAWFVARLIVDGDGRAVGLMARRDVGGEMEAHALLASMAVPSPG